MRIKEYINIIRKRWWLAILVALVAAAVAFGYSLTQPKTYEATAKLLGDVGKPDNGLYEALKQKINGYPSRFTSTDFANAINQRGKFDLSPDAIIGKIKVQALPAQFTFVIQVTDTDADRAARLANTAADILVEENVQSIANLSQDQQIYVTNAAPASKPNSPTGPRTNLNTLAGAILGLVLGLIFIFAIELLDDSIKDEEELERISGLTIMGVVPAWKPNGLPGTPIKASIPMASADAGTPPELATNPKQKTKARE